MRDIKKERDATLFKERLAQISPRHRQHEIVVGHHVVIVITLSHHVSHPVSHHVSHPVSHHVQQIGHQPCMVVNPVCGQLNREHDFSLATFAPGSCIVTFRFGPRCGPS